MISYKTPQADLEGKKSLFFEIGLILSLLAVLLAFQIKTPIRTSNLSLNLSELNMIEEEVLNTHQPPPPPPAPPRPQNITLLKVVEDNTQDIQEIEIRVEADQTTEIPLYVPAERFGQEEEQEIKEEEIFLVVEQQPEFPGGYAALNRFLHEQIKYPNPARELNIQGTVYVSFVVEPDGSISNITLLRGIGAGCDEEAMRVVSEMPRWSPGKQRNKPVRVRFNLPVRFVLV
jgi:periplasmic protein TonB